MSHKGKRTRSHDLVIHVTEGENGIIAAEQLLSERIASYKRRKIGDRTLDEKLLEKSPEETKAELAEHLALYNDIIYIARHAGTRMTGTMVLFTGGENFKVAMELCALKSETYTSICDTEGGRILENLQIFTPDSPVPADVGVQAFDEFSERMCRDYAGDIIAFCHKAGPSRCLTAIELRILLDNPNVGKINGMDKKAFVETFIAHEYMNNPDVRHRTKSALETHFSDLDITVRADALKKKPLSKDEIHVLYGLSFLDEARAKA